MQPLKFFLGIGLAIVLVFTAASVYSHFTKISPAPVDRETLYQVSTINALMQGAFDGVEPVGELKKHGDFGIGTFDALDGEMIVLNGVVYQAKSDGKIYQVPDNATTPFATVTYFDRDGTVTTARSMNLTTFFSEMAGRLPSPNMEYAVRMHGTFPTMKVRAIPTQHKPYPTLTDAAKTQAIYTYTNTTGTVVGFYTPVFFTQLDVVGFHLHFISDDRHTGGHILDFTVPENTMVEYDITPGFTMVLPTNGTFTTVNLSQDVSSDLEKVEK
jgi:acetolactate decarboxylase